MKTSLKLSICLAGLLSVLLFNPGAHADYYGRSNRPHGHTNNTDGGTLGNVSITGNFTAAGVLSAAYPTLIVQDQKAPGTDGGTCTAGSWQTRDLNTVTTNTITGASLSSNQITLPAGTYYAQWSAPAQAVNSHQSIFVSTPTATIVSSGTVEVANGSVFMTTRSIGAAMFTIAGSQAFELQHRCQTTNTVDGFGIFGNFTTEVYSLIEIWKIK